MCSRLDLIKDMDGKCSGRVMGRWKDFKETDE